MELAILHEVPCQNIQLNMLYSPMLHYNPDEYAITKIERKQITLTKPLGSGAFGEVKISFFKQCFKLISRSRKQTFPNKDINYMNFYSRLYVI